MLLRDSCIRAIRDLCSTSTESMHRSRKPIFGTPTGKTLHRALVWPGMSPATVVSVRYLGTGIRHTQSADMLNPAIYVPGNGDTNGSCFLNGQATYFKVTPGTACSTIANTQARRSLSFLNPASANEVGRMGI